MLIPLNSKKADNLCLSIIKTNDKFSVAIVEITNGFLQSIPSYKCNDDGEINEYDEELKVCVTTTDFPVFEENDLYVCIEQALTALKEKGYY